MTGFQFGFLSSWKVPCKETHLGNLEDSSSLSEETPITPQPAFAKRQFMKPKNGSIWTRNGAVPQPRRNRSLVSKHCFYGPGNWVLSLKGFLKQRRVANTGASIHLHPIKRILGLNMDSVTQWRPRRWSIISQFSSLPPSDQTLIFQSLTNEHCSLPCYIVVIGKTSFHAANNFSSRIGEQGITRMAFWR